MRKTGKISTVLLTALLATLILASTCKPAQASIQSYSWKPGTYVYKGYDSYYGSSIVAYLDGTTVYVTIPVINDYYGSNINVTAVNMVFDWGLNKSCSRTLPVKIDYGKTEYFDISFTADISKASNAWAHTYTTYVKYNYTYGQGTWTMGYDYKFVVYSQSQKDVMDLSREYSAYSSNYPPYNFQIIKGRLLATQAGVEASQAQTFVGIGNFTAAKTHYQTAIDLYDQAFAAEEDKGVAKEDAALNATIKEADAAVKTADAAMVEAQAVWNQAYGYILFGLGFLLIGVGAILYGLTKKPKTA